MARPSSVQVATKENYVNILDIHKPEIADQLVDRYAGKNLLDFFASTGKEEQISQASFSHYEKDLIHEYLTVSTTVADPGAGNSSTFTIASTDYRNTGTLSIGQPNQLVMIMKNKVKCFITAKDTSTPSAHTVTIAPLKATDNIGALAASDVIIIYSNAYAEDTGQPLSEDSSTLKFTFYMQKIKRTYNVSGDESTNRTWFEVKGPKGKTGYLWYLNGLLDTATKFDVDLELAMLIGDTVTNTALTNIGIQTMQGYMPFVEANGGVVQRTGGPGMFSLPQFDSMIRKLNKNFGAKENTVWMGLPLRQDTDNFLQNLTPNGAISYGAFNGKQEIALSFGFSSFHRSGYTFHFKQYDMFDHPKLLGAPGGDYGWTGIVMPNEMTKDVATGKSVPVITLCYKGAEGYSRRYESWQTGGAVLPPNERTDDSDHLLSHLRAHRSIRIAAANKCAIIRP